MVELYNALKLITMLYFIEKILRLNLGVAFLKSVSIPTFKDVIVHEGMKLAHYMYNYFFTSEDIYTGNVSFTVGNFDVP